MIQASGYFEILLGEETIVLNGKVTTEFGEGGQKNREESELPDRTAIKIEAAEFYDFLAKIGYRLNDCFVSVEDLFHDRADYFANIRWQGNWVAFLDSLMKFHKFSSTRKNNRRLYPCFVRKLFIYAPQTVVNSENSIACQLNLAENVFRCCGVEMFGLTFKPVANKWVFPNVENTKFLNYKFVEYSNPQCRDVRSFLKVSLQLISDNLVLHQSEEDKFCIIKNNANPLSKAVIKLVKENDFLQLRTVIKSVKEISNKFSNAIKCVLMISDHEYVQNGLHFDQLYVLLILRPLDKIPNDIEEFFVEVTKQSFENNRFYLFKKKQKTVVDGNPAPLLVKSENFKLHDNDHSETKNIVVVRKTIETEDLSIILNNTKKRDSRKRFLYILDDENLPKSDDIRIKNRLSLNFSFSIIRNGAWGFYKDVTEETIEKESISIIQPLMAEEISLKTAMVHCFYTENNFENGIANETQAISYAGVRPSGQCIVGITTINSFEADSDIHPHLTWTIPKAWSSAEAFILPAVFAQAYNIMHIKTGGRSVTSVLINMGKENLLTEACILIALKNEYTVYVTVSNDLEAKIIEESFSQMQMKGVNILKAEMCDYESQILYQTCGKGVSVVVNCLPGLNNITASLNCVSFLGVYVEVGDTNADYEHKLGLNPFLKSVSMYKVRNRITGLLNLCDEEQKILKTAMQEGINSGVVKPFAQRDKVQTKFGTPTVVRNLYGKKFVGRMTQKLQYNSNYSYIVVGNEKKDYSWFDYVEWLISKGARKFILALNHFTKAPKISYQMNRLLNQKDVSIIITPIERTNSVDKSTKLLDEASKLGYLEAILFINTESGNNRIYNIDSALQSRKQSTHLISIFSGGLEVCEKRRENGFSAIVVHGENSKKISAYLPQTDRILSTFVNGISPTLYKVIDQASTSEEEAERILLQAHFPADLKLLEDIGYQITQESQFIEIRSLSLPYKESIGVYPIFVIPSIRNDQLRPLIRKLMYPVFCATLAKSHKTLQEVVSDLSVELVDIQPTGPVTLVGETWSACIAIELSKIIELSNRKCKLILIEGNPNKWKNLLSQLGQPLSPQFDANFFKTVLKLPEITVETFTNLGDTFEERLKSYLCKFAPAELKTDLLIETVVALRGRLTFAAQYEVSNQPLKNTVLLLQRYSEDSSFKFSAISSMNVFEEDDYEVFIRDPRICQIVNDNALFSWWDYTKRD